MKVLLRNAERLVREAGDRAKSVIHVSNVVGHKEHDDIFTEGDLIVEKHIIDSMAALYPDHGFHSEERGILYSEDTEYVWILDPIDGTRHYAKGNPLYSVSLALERGGDLVLGIVYCPEFGQMYAARVGHGATLNGDPIHCSMEKQLEDSTISLEIPSKHARPEALSWALEKMHTLINGAQRVRILGVGSIGLCLCAMGGYDAWVSLGSAWKYVDVAAGQVILKEAGGQFYTFGRQIIAGPAVLCEQILDLIDIESAPGEWNQKNSE